MQYNKVDYLSFHALPPHQNPFYPGPAVSSTEIETHQVAYSER
jgi:hypothetical protein